MRPRPGLAHISHPAQAVLKTTDYRTARPPFPIQRSTSESRPGNRSRISPVPLATLFPFSECR